MANPNPAAVTAISKKKLDAFIMDARAFIAYGVAHHLNNTAILSNISHDIFGLAEGDKLMLPRVTGYQSEHPFEKFIAATGNAALGGGSGLGCLLPILNAQRKPQSKAEELKEVENAKEG